MPPCASARQALRAGHFEGAGTHRQARAGGRKKSLQERRGHAHLVVAVVGHEEDGDDEREEGRELLEVDIVRGAAVCSRARAAEGGMLSGRGQTLGEAKGCCAIAAWGAGLHAPGTLIGVFSEYVSDFSIIGPVQSGRHE